MANANVVKGFSTVEEMNEYIVSEVKKASSRSSFNNNIDASDLESYLIIRVWTAVKANSQYQTERGIRQIIKSRIINFLNSPTNHNSDVDLFSSLGNENKEGSETSFEDVYIGNQPSVEDTVIEGNVGQAFLKSLSETQKRILGLKLDGYSQKDMCAIIYPDSTYEASRKSIQRSMKAITELALDFGLEDVQ